MDNKFNTTAWLPENWTEIWDEMHFFGRVVQFNDRTFHAFCEEEIGELMPKNIARAARIQLDGQQLLFGE